MNKKSSSGESERLRVLRIAHASLTPALRARERAIVSRHPEVDLELVTTRRWREAEVAVEAVDDDLFRVWKSGTYLSKHIQLFAYDPRVLINALRRHRPHLIDLNHEPYSVACAEVLTLCRWFAPRTPIVMGTLQNILKNYPPPFSMLEQRAFRRVAAAYTCSETVIEVLRTKGFRKPIAVIPFGVDLQSFSQRRTARSTNEPLTIGFIGRMLPEKGLPTLAAALAQISSLNWRLLLVGDGQDRAPMERRLSGSGLLERTRFTGAVPYEAMPDYFRQIDILVLPTQTTGRVREQFGRVLVEAMAGEICVVGSTCGAIPEVIADAGLVFPEGDATALAAALRSLVSDDELRVRLAHAGRRRVEQHYTWERIGDQMYDFFRQSLQPLQSLNSHASRQHSNSLAP